ncbi:hypothetical protein MASR2M18_11910 [Ignavibacteria bacterium]|nr:DUF4115 domain-containing protein [Bacteroidota bacterium]
MTPLSQELIKRREERCWTIEDVSAKTRIRVHILESIEQGNYNTLPAAYVRSYLKIYSQLVGISDDEMIVLWNESVPAPPLEQTSYTSSQNNGEHANPTLLNGKNVKVSQPLVATIVYSAVALFIGVLVYYFLFREEPSPTLSLRPGELADTSNITDDTQSKGNGMLSYFNNAFPADSIILEAHASDTAWITINMDGQRSQQITLTPTQQFRWAAKEYFILSLGNSGSINLKRNGQELQKFGQKGTIVRQVKITEKEVVASSEPYSPPAPVASQKTAATQGSPQKQAQNTNVASQKTAATQASTTNSRAADSHIIKSKPKPPTKPQVKKQTVAARKNVKQKQKVPQPALQRILRNASRENKKQPTVITPVIPVPASQSPSQYRPQPIRPIDKKSDE